MHTFENVTVVKKANVYFGGKVTSRTLHFADGSKKTLGYMLPGEYEFNTDAPEQMQILSGKLEVKLPGNQKPQLFQGGQSFEVPGASTFSLKVLEGTDYCCCFKI